MEMVRGLRQQLLAIQFINELKKRGYKARYFYYKEAKMKGMVIEYYIGHAALGPWSVDKAAKRIGEATALMDAAIKIHNN